MQTQFQVPITSATFEEVHPVMYTTQDSTNQETESDLVVKLQPLLEQEAILESFIDEAKARRKFEDVSSLSTSLKEIQAEISRLVNLSRK